MNYENWGTIVFGDKKKLMSWVFKNLKNYEMHSKGLTVKYLPLTKKHKSK